MTSKVTHISEAKKPDWDLVKAIYQEGGSDPEVARALNVTMKKFYQLLDDVPAFAEFVELGRTMSMAWWYEQGRKGLTADKFNGPLFNFNMKNRHGWADKTDVSTTDTTSHVNQDQLKSEMAQIFKRLAKTSPELLSGAYLTKDVKEVETDEQ